jgi:hypothetical protein
MKWCGNSTFPASSGGAGRAIESTHNRGQTMLNRLLWVLRRWRRPFDDLLAWWEWRRHPMRLRVGDVVRVDGGMATVTHVGKRQRVVMVERHDAC